MTTTQQAEYDRAVAVGSLTAGTPVVAFSEAQQLSRRYGLATGTMRGSIMIWSDDTRSVAVSFPEIKNEKPSNNRP